MISLESLKNITEVIAIVTGGIWALYRFGLFRERFPSMEIINGINYIGENSDEYLLELYCIVENKGKVRKWIAPFEFNLKYLSNNDQFKKGKEISWQIQMNEIEISEDNPTQRRYWVSPDWYFPFVDGESKKRFQYLTAVPKSIKYLSLNTRFIDFNSKQKAGKYILSEKNERNLDKESQRNMNFMERVNYVKNKKTDFYFTRINISIESLKTKNIKEESA